MGPYLAKRILATTFMLVGLVVATFVLTHVVPSDPARLAAGFNATPQQVAAVRRQLGLDESLGRQFVHYVGQLLHGDLGTSFVTERPVSTDIAQFLPATIELVLAATVLMILGGVTIGAYLALGRRPSVRNTLRFASIAVMGLPSFVIALLLQILFFGRLGWFPSGGRLDPQQSIPAITHLYTVDSLIEGEWSLFASALWHLVLPAASLALYRMGMVARFVESQILQVAGADYIRTARAKGVSVRRVLLAHIAPNAATPVLAVVGLELGALLTGSIFVESIYSWPGMGNYIVESVAALDFSPVIASALVIGVAYVTINFIVDVMQRVLDPRVSLT